MSLYKNIKAKREELGMSQSELAKKTGYTSRSSIAKIEKGLVDLTQTKIELFATALNTSPAILMGWDEIEDEMDSIIYDIDTFDKRVAFYTNFRKILEILGYNIATNWNQNEAGEQIDLIEDNDFEIEIPHSVYRETMNSILSYIEFQLKELFQTYEKKSRDKKYDNYTLEDFDKEEVRAAHERTDIKVTAEMKKHDDDIMNDDSEWE